MTEGWEDPGRGGDWRAPAPWWRRVWVVTPVLALLGAGAIAVSPQLRHQVALTTTRIDPEFVELGFADEALARACLHSPQGSGFVIEVRSHLRAPATVGWTATVSGSDRVVSGRVETVPDHPARATVRFRAPGPSYVVRVDLRGRPEHLVLRCGEGDSR